VAIITENIFYLILNANFIIRQAKSCLPGHAGKRLAAAFGATFFPRHSIRP
jgi:hypothetical protein